jgi:hypothetical protein
MQVLASFVLTVTATSLAVLYGYFSEALPDCYLNEFDRRIIANWRSTVLSRVERIFHMKPSDAASRLRTLEKRQEALQRFILTLSDQQLVTGLAIIITGLVMHC